MSAKTTALELLAHSWATLSMQGGRVFIRSGLAWKIDIAAGSKGKVDALRINERRVMKLNPLDKMPFLSIFKPTESTGIYGGLNQVPKQ